MYTPILQPSDLVTYIYPEILDEITRADGGALATAAIDMAIEEAKMYLTRYDLIQIFGDAATNVSATYRNASIDDMIKIIAVWKIIQLGNPNINYEQHRVLYQDTIRKLERIQDGKSDPRYPYYDTSTETAPPSDQVTIIANPKRSNYY